MRRRNHETPQTDPHSLLNRKTGLTAEYARLRLGRSHGGRLDQLEHDNRILRRSLAFLRGFQGFKVYNSARDAYSVVRPDSQGWIHDYSSDDSIQQQRNPNTNPNIIDRTTAGGGGGGCEDVFSSVIVGVQQCDASGCVNEIEFIAGECISLTLGCIPNGSGGNRARVQIDVDTACVCAACPK